MRRYFFIALLLLLFACNNATQSAETTSITPSSNVTIKIVGATTPEFRKIREETIPQPNCGGNAEVENVVERTRSIKREIETGSQFAISATGEIGIAGTGVGLGAEVANHLGFSYGVEENVSRSLIVKARPGTSMSHTVKLIEVWEVGTAVIIIADEIYEIPFSIRNDFALELIDSIENPCPTPIQSNMMVTPANTPTPIVLPPSTIPVPEMVIVPHVEQLSLGDGESRLIALGLNPQTVEVIDEEHAGLIIEQSPKAGMEVAKESDVKIIVGIGILPTPSPIDGIWEFNVQFERAIDSNGNIKNSSSNYERIISLSQDGSILTGKIIGATAGCANANINGMIQNSNISWEVEFTCSSCPGIRNEFNGTINLDGTTPTITGDQSPIGRPPSGCSQGWAKLTGRKQE